MLVFNGRNPYYQPNTIYGYSFSDQKVGQFLHHFHQRSAIFQGPRLNFGYVVQFFILYKLVKKYSKKNGMFMSKLTSHYPEIERFLMILSKNRTFIAVFIARIHLYIKMNVIFRISAKNSRLK